MGNNRVYYGCLGVALAAPTSFPSSLLPGVQSVGITSSVPIERVGSIGSTNFVSYSTLPDISFTFTEAISSLSGILNIPGINGYIDLFMFIGQDDTECFSARKFIRCKYVLLTNIQYNMSIDGIFTCEKTYSGFSRFICPTSSGITVPTCSTGFPANTHMVGTRRNFNLSGSSLPNTINVDNLIQEVSLSYSINRSTITEPGTRTPYGSSVQFPVETRCSFTVANKNLDSYQNNFAILPCTPINATPEDITLSICGKGNFVTGSVSVSGAYVTNINYDGGTTGGGNQNINIEYTSTNNPGIVPLVEFPNNATTGCGS